ncbi:MAG: hypothetical protein F4X65_01220 [Chloroflexi bacterium]|nr:hypothetical protein [Chloroflexota bacterium]
MNQDINETTAEHLEREAPEALGDAGARLEAALVALARSLRPFPAFMGMVSVQAIELEPPFKPLRDLGCVVVDPEGQICQLDVTSVGGLAGVIEADQVEVFQPLELTPLEYLVYADTAIALLSEELRRRGR